jgi:hypothetical protein
VLLRYYAFDYEDLSVLRLSAPDLADTVNYDQIEYVLA